MKDFRRLMVWRKAHQLALSSYKVSASFPKEELYGLTSQIRRSAISIPSNIAEACGRNGNGEFAHFLQIAMGSTRELEYQIFLALELKLLRASDYETLSKDINEIERMLASLIRKTRKDLTNC